MGTKHLADAEGTFYVANVPPDLCKVGKVIIPFDIIQQHTPELGDYAKTVFALGNPVLMQGSIIQAVKGDAGSGIVSGTSMGSGHSRILQGAPTVFVEGRPVARHMDDVSMNGPFSGGAGAPSAKGGGVKSGLGESVDSLVEKSPTLQKDLDELKKDGWEIKYGEAGKGSSANREAKVITLDGNLKSNPRETVQVLSHEVGHAKYPFTPDYSSKGAYVNGTLADEGAATMKNIQVQREIIANGGPDIGIAGNSANHGVYNGAYDQYLKDGNAAGARQTIGTQIGIGEKTSTSGQNYNDYYGGWYDKNFPPKKP